MIIAAQGLEDINEPLINFINEEFKEYGYTRVSACAAYATYRGVVLLRSALSEVKQPQYRWLLGLNDNFTDPQAIKISMGASNSETRLVRFTNGRFHMKAYLLDMNEAKGGTLIIGSNNLTEAAFTKNGEAYAAFRAESAEQLKELQDYWEKLWKIGAPATEDSIEQYKQNYKRNRTKLPEVKEEVKKKKISRQVKDAVKSTVNSSRLVWIELGKNTGGGNQLDIVKKLAPFLGLPDNPAEGNAKVLPFDSPQNRQNFTVTFTKGMWRFMNLQQGFNVPLRPDSEKPSPYVLVIERNGKNVPSMSIQTVNSRETKRMIKQSKENGFLGASLGSTGRQFGWY